jgi:hypothetical protein
MGLFVVFEGTLMYGLMSDYIAAEVVEVNEEEGPAAGWLPVSIGCWI